jgi:succinate dehydrogenase/fumarate reductase iron-sulfur protein
MKGRVDMVSISVTRYDPERGGEPTLETYQVPAEEDVTVLGALLYIYETHDSTLAFSYGCRNETCGLCAMDINGEPRIACTAPLEAGMVIRPLQGLTVARDLIVERKWIMPFLRRFDLFLPEGNVDQWPQPLTIPEEYTRLTACTECLSCLADCPSYEHGRDDLGGPYHFVKLAQLHWDPRNTIDRRTQAAQLGISRCVKCCQCQCPVGIPIYHMAVAPLARP